MARERNIWTLSAAATLLVAGLLTGCGTSSTDPDGGSKHNTMTGVSGSGYPGGQPVYAGSPALASSTESQYSRWEEQEAAKEAKKEEKK